MSAGDPARRFENDAAFSENSHFPEPVVQAPNEFYDDPPEPASESATETFLSWIKRATHEGDVLCSKHEIAARVTALVDLISGGEKAIAQLSHETGIPHSKIHRRIKLLSAKTGLVIPRRKKTRGVGSAR